MSLFEGSAPDPVELSKSSVTKTPEYLTNYLTQLAGAGMGALGTVTPGTLASGDTPATPATVTPFTGQQLIAERPDFYKNLMTPGEGTLPKLSDLTRYQSPLSTAATTAGYAQGVDAADISKFYDLNQQEVINKMQEQSDKNLQRSVLPALKALGISSGQFGSSRIGNIGGQALADIAADLQAQQTAARSKGFQTALDAALKEQGVQQGLVGSLGTVGSAEATAAQNAIKSLSEAGASDLAYEQSLIDAPLKRALNVAEIMRGYQYPTTIDETKEELPTNFSPSALQQIAGLGTLVGAAFPAGGKGVGDKIIGSIEKIFSGGSDSGWGSLGSLSGGGTETGLMGDYGT